MLLKKIVVAEDDDAIAHMVNMALGDAGFLCLRARDGEEALNVVRMHAPDLLVLDVMMPKLDGMEVARKLKADVILSRIPILMLTALGSVESKVDGFEAGADDYMVKPFDLREFAARVNALIRSARRERERNPTTNLPGAGAIDAHLSEAIERGDDLAVVHIALRHFDGHADQIGYARAEELVATLGRMVLDRTRTRSGDEAFVGHLGGADFIAVAPRGAAEDLAREIIDGFEARRAEWTEGGDDRLAMAVAVAPTDGLAAAGGAGGDGAGPIDRLAERLAAAMRTAKQRDGSSHVFWKPETA